MNKKVNYILLLIFTVLVLYFSLRDDFLNVVSNIYAMQPIWVILAVLLMCVYWIFKALIIKRYASYYQKAYTFKKAFSLQMKTMFFNGITPFSSGGQPFQVLSLKKDGIRMSDGSNIIIISSFLHQISLFTFMSIAIIANRFIHMFPENSFIRRLCILGFVINVIFILFLLLIMFSKKFNETIVNFVIKMLHKIKVVKKKEEAIAKWHSYIESLNNGSKMIMNDSETFILCYIYNMIALLGFILVPLAVARGMNINTFGVSETIVSTSYVEMIGMFVPIPGGTGGIEFAFSHLYNTFINGSSVNAVMLVWRFITYYLGIALGGIALNVKKRSKA